MARMFISRQTVFTEEAKTRIASVKLRFGNLDFLAKQCIQAIEGQGSVRKDVVYALFLFAIKSLKGGCLSTLIKMLVSTAFISACGLADVLVKQSAKQSSEIT